MYAYEIIPYLQGILKKLSKKNKPLYEQVLTKINEVMNTKNIEHYKNLRYDLKDRKRVHIDKSFVLTFMYIKSESKVVFLDFDHHDNIYK